MANELNAESDEQARARKYCEIKSREVEERWIEFEQARLNVIFSTLGNVEPYLPRVHSEDKSTRLADIRSGIEAGDRKAMLAHLDIMADALRAFDVLPKNTREALADGAVKMRKNLENSKGFLPLKRGQKPADFDSGLNIALRIEYRRYLLGESLADAMANVVSVVKEFGVSDSVVHKRWKLHHKLAKSIINRMYSALDVVADVTGVPNSMQPAKRQRTRSR
ncbi:MAG: hypothetical protein HY306_12500 [Nitrosomonadales bacterium]|nr:hypothetical protein [Nitrosomonadales bacterium]